MNLEDEYKKKLDTITTLCQQLMKTPHYSKHTPEAIFAIVSTSKALNIDPFVALDGGLYYAKGKVEMKASLMNAKIREQKHSITKDKRSDDTICILHGKRSDNGDTWTESFSIEDAQKAGIFNHVWKNYTRDMLFARALSRLARQLFADVIGNCYVEGEISLDDNIKDPKISVKPDSTPTPPVQQVEKMSAQQVEEINVILEKCPAFKNVVMAWLPKLLANSIADLPSSMYPRIIAGAKKELEIIQSQPQEQNQNQNQKQEQEQGVENE